MVNPEILVLRILHIVSGAFWVGTIFFMVLILRPRLRSLGADRRLTQSIDSAVNAATGIAGVITVAAGIGLALRLRWGHLDTFLNSGWGFAILIGFIAALAAFAVGATEARAISTNKASLDSSPDSIDAATTRAMDARMVVLGRLQAAFVLVAVGSMASARFV